MENGYLKIDDHNKAMSEQRKDFLWTFGVAFCIMSMCWGAVLLYAIGSYFGTYYDEGTVTTSNNNNNYNNNTNNIGGPE